MNRVWQIAAVSLAFAGGTARADDIVLLYNERPPYIVAQPDGSVTGLVADAAAHALTKAGIAYRWVETPTIRQFDAVKADTGTVCAVGWYKNPERESFARFSVPLHHDLPPVILGRADDARLRGRTVDSLFSDKSLHLIVKVGYSYGPVLDAKLVELNPTAEAVTQEAAGMATIIGASHADYMIFTREEGEYIIRQPELASSKLALYDVDGMPEGENRYLVCSHKVPESTLATLSSFLPH
jgi:uncharacterized protein (TIGR02285 family)